MPEDHRNMQQDKDIQEMKIQMAKHEVQIHNLELNLREQNGMLRNIQEKVESLTTGLGNRPSWLITWILGGLLTAVGTLAMFIITTM